MVSTIIHQLTRNLDEDKILETPFAPYFVDHTTGVYPTAAAGVPHDMMSVGIKGDPIADLNEDLAADVAIMHRQAIKKASKKAQK